MNIDDITSAPNPDDVAEVDGEQIPMAFRGRIDYGYLYHRMFSGLQHLHATNQDTRAHELFYSSISDFGSLWDNVFVENFVKIQNRFPDENTTQYRLHKVEFARLLQRAGIAPRPDVRLVINPKWEVPKTVDEVSGRKPADGGPENVQESLEDPDDDMWEDMYNNRDNNRGENDG